MWTPMLQRTHWWQKLQLKITNIGVHGYPGTGKTSVLDLAMGKPPADTRTSTDCIEPPDRYMMTGSEDSSGELSIHWGAC